MKLNFINLVFECFEALLVKMSSFVLYINCLPQSICYAEIFSWIGKLLPLWLDYSMICSRVRFSSPFDHYGYETANKDLIALGLVV